jgi:exoribonuclease-2
MLAAGEAAARYAVANELPIPFAAQDAPDKRFEPNGMADMYAYRRHFKRSRMQTSAAPHAGLGLPAYARATSPLRRYFDLVVHQQIRAYLTGTPVLNAAAIVERVGAAENAGYQIRQAERASNRHWTLAFLARHPDWQGQAVLVDKRGGRGTVIIPALALEAPIALEGDPPLNATITIKAKKVDLANQTVRLKAQSQWQPN